ncbi:MAG: DMT family transporter, partial [[Clostridium] innocuum]
LLICWKKLRRLDRATIGHGIVTGIFLFLAFAFQTFGLKYSTPSKNAFLTATNVVFVPYLLWLLWHRRPSRKELIASLLCIVGIALLTLKKDALMLGFGDMLSLVCALFFVHTLPERYSPMWTCVHDRFANDSRVISDMH